MNKALSEMVMFVRLCWFLWLFSDCVDVVNFPEKETVLSNKSPFRYLIQPLYYIERNFYRTDKKGYFRKLFWELIIIENFY